MDSPFDVEATNMICINMYKCTYVVHMYIHTNINFIYHCCEWHLSLGTRTGQLIHIHIYKEKEERAIYIYIYIYIYIERESEPEREKGREKEPEREREGDGEIWWEEGGPRGREEGQGAEGRERGLIQ